MINYELTLFSVFSGWGKEDTNQFLKSITDFEKIDLEEQELLDSVERITSIRYGSF